MNLAMLKSFERAYFRLYQLGQKELKRNPSFGVEAQKLTDQWLAANKRRKEALEIATARRDKGGELFTVFIPDKNGVKEEVHTKLRVITTHHWRNLFGVPGYHNSGPHIDCNPWPQDPWFRFKKLLNQEVAA